MSVTVNDGPACRGGLGEALRQAIRASGRPLLGLAKASGTDAGNLSRFMRGQRDLKLETVDRLAAELNLALMPARGAGEGGA